MTANTTPALTEITIGDQMWQLAKGDEITLHTAAGEVIVGIFVSLTPRGIRIHATPVMERTKYVTRKLSVVTNIELRGDDAAPAAGETTVITDPAQPEAAETSPAAAPEPLTDAKVDSEFAALVQATAAEQAAESNEDAPAADYDRDPMVGGRRLSEMKFAEVMTLAKQYKTPGRGVARIGALREGVALAISQEAGRLASAS